MSRLPGLLPLDPRPVPAARRVRRGVAPALALALAGGLLATAPTAPATAAPAPTRHSFTQLTSTAQLATGTREGVRVVAGSVRMGTPVQTRAYAGKRWQVGRWTSGWVAPGHDFAELIPSWEATTPRGTFVQVSARVASTSRTSGWKVVGRWSGREDTINRTSAGSQVDSVATVATDVVRAAPGVSLQRYQLRVELLRRAGIKRAPQLRSVQAVASRLGGASATSRHSGVVRTLAVPRYSQMVHRGRYPQYGGGGQAWCSPTSLAMVLGYHGALPRPSTYSWVSSSFSDRVVPALARGVYDHGYRGAGNWAFNTAYAANRAGGAFVTRLGSLRDAERFIAAGTPLVTSISFSSGGLRGAPISSTAGHLVVVVGFTAGGDVVVHDPAAPSNATVRRVYDRAQFERAWQTRSRGLTYVVHSARHPLPQHRLGA